MDILFRDQTIGIEVVHIKYQLKFCFKRRVVDTEHGFHKFLLVYIFIPLYCLCLIHNVKETFTKYTRKVHVL